MPRFKYWMIINNPTYRIMLGYNPYCSIAKAKYTCDADNIAIENYNYTTYLSEINNMKTIVSGALNNQKTLAHSINCLKRAYYDYI